MTAVTGPLDPLHKACLSARRAIRRRYLWARYRAGQWEPRPMPERWGR